MKKFNTKPTKETKTAKPGRNSPQRTQRPQRKTLMVLGLAGTLALPMLAQGTDSGSQSFNFEWLAPLLAPVVESLAGKYGWIEQVLVVIGALRVAFKPVMFFLEQRDPVNIGNFERGPVYKVISFILDFGASIKVNQLPNMKKTIGPTILMATLLAALGGCATGCVTRPDGTKTVDVAKLSQAKAIIEPVAASAIRRVLQRSPEHAPAIAKYAFSFAAVFCTMSLSNEFRPEFLMAEADKFADPELAKIGDGYLIDAKNAAVGIYKLLWGDRFRAEIPETNWLHSVCAFFCESINQALTDGGYPGGVRKTSAGMRQRIDELMREAAQKEFVPARQQVFPDGHRLSAKNLGRASNPTSKIREPELARRPDLWTGGQAPRDLAKAETHNRIAKNQMLANGSAAFEKARRSLSLRGTCTPRSLT